MTKTNDKSIGNGIKNIVVISDLHAGCRLGLINPNVKTRLDDGGTYVASRLQKKMWGIWCEFWEEWIPRVTHGEDFACVVNGDAVDGVHHRNTASISNNLKDQIEIARVILQPVADACRGRFYLIRGTPAHVGEQGVWEELLGRQLGAVPNEDGQCSRYELWKTLGNGNKYLAHFTHHIGTTSSAQHETSAVNAELTTSFVEAGRWNRKPPNVIVRSHRHRCSEIRIPSRDGYSISFVTAAWQGKTPFLYRIAGGRQNTPQFGGSLIRVGDEELHTRHFTRDIGRGKPE